MLCVRAIRPPSFLLVTEILWSKVGCSKIFYLTTYLQTILSSQNKIMSTEKIAELKALCLTLATLNCKHCPTDVLRTAETDYSFLIKQNL